MDAATGQPGTRAPQPRSVAAKHAQRARGPKSVAGEQQFMLTSSVVGHNIRFRILTNVGEAPRQSIRRLKRYWTRSLDSRLTLVFYTIWASESSANFRQHW